MLIICLFAFDRNRFMKIKSAGKKQSPDDTGHEQLTVCMYIHITDR